MFYIERLVVNVGFCCLGLGNLWFWLLWFFCCKFSERIDVLIVCVGLFVIGNCLDLSWWILFVVVVCNILCLVVVMLCWCVLVNSLDWWSVSCYCVVVWYWLCCVLWSCGVWWNWLVLLCLVCCGVGVVIGVIFDRWCLVCFRFDWLVWCVWFVCFCVFV